MRRPTSAHALHAHWASTRRSGQQGRARPAPVRLPQPRRPRRDRLRAVEEDVNRLVLQQADYMEDDADRDARKSATWPSSGEKYPRHASRRVDGRLLAREPLRREPTSTTPPQVAPVQDRQARSRSRPARADQTALTGKAASELHPPRGGGPRRGDAALKVPGHWSPERGHRHCSTSQGPQEKQAPSAAPTRPRRSRDQMLAGRTTMARRSGDRRRHAATPDEAAGN